MNDTASEATPRPCFFFGRDVYVVAISGAQHRLQPRCRRNTRLPMIQCHHLGDGCSRDRMRRRRDRRGIDDLNGNETRDEFESASDSDFNFDMPIDGSDFFILFESWVFLFFGL